MACYRQVTLYAIRTPLGEDIIEGNNVVVKTKCGEQYHGTLHDVGYTKIELINVGCDCDKEVSVEYDDIENIREVW